ncbi:hypothetical protein Tco_1081795 [Tanacetum coccineum]|uniref:Uncharacterized protein n=1 Tax=Tanacetum coccineum TaxID=301880 RepID=A0ABQ5HYL9_9ASTR
MLRVPPENTEFEGEIIPCSDFPARYLDFGLEELVPSLWVESEREYDISVAYGITHWWFLKKRNYTSTNTVSSLIVRRVDRSANSQCDQCHGAFKNLYQTDIEDLFLLNIQEKAQPSAMTDKDCLHTAVNHVDKKLVAQESCGRLSSD